jgi:RNA polymerase sigma-B factor
VGTNSSRGANIERERLIESHLALVRGIAQRYAGRGESLDDLIQVGSIGLIKASDRFDPDRGVAFATFASAEIEGEIRRHLRDRTSSPRIPRAVQRQTGELRKRHAELTAALRRSPTVSELAVALDADEREVQQIMRADSARASIPISSDEATFELAGASEPLARSDDRLLLARSVRVLDERQRRIVLLRFHGDMTERQIARELGISQAHVSRLLGEALAKLRADLEEPGGDATDTGSEPVVSGGHEPWPGGSRDTTIAPVVGSQENRALEQYLELPYHVAVRSKRAGDEPIWCATVEELSGCSARGSTPDEAVGRLRPAMEAWLSDALSHGREIPRPNRERRKSKSAPSHSGRFLVRMPSELHEQLARAAQREDVSLNRHVTDVLAASVARTPAGAGAPDDVRRPEQDSGPQTTAVQTAQTMGKEHDRARSIQLALATNLVVVVFAGLVAVALLVLALERGI